MNKTVRLVMLMVISAAVVFAGGCAKKNHWFHGDYPEFRPGPEGGADLIEINEEIDHTKYKFIYMDPVLFQYASPSKYNAISPEVRRELKKAFHNAFVAALGDAYPFVDKPRPDALRVRVAIVGLVPAIQSSDPSVPPISVGGASMKAELLDAWTNERVGAVMDAKKGNLSAASGNMDEWSHTRQVFRYWAQRLRNWLDITHSRK